MKTRLPSFLRSEEKQTAFRYLSLARIAGIAIVFSVLGFLLAWHYDNPSIFWGVFAGTNFIITIFLVVGYFVIKHQKRLRFYLPTLMWVYGVMQLLLIIWEVFLKNH